jgi:hypothetical protein
MPYRPGCETRTGVTTRLLLNDVRPLTFIKSSADLLVGSSVPVSVGDGTTDVFRLMVAMEMCDLGGAQLLIGLSSAAK